MPEHSNAVLKVDHLRVELTAAADSVVALDDVCLEIAPGEILGVVGESGAGKSLTGLAITGLLDPPCRIAGGRIVLNGSTISGLPERRLQAIRGRAVGTIFQDPLTALDPLFRIGEQLVETIRVHTSLGRAAATAQAIDLLAQVELPSPAALMDAYPHQLSGGMRQRVVIALALCADPTLVIADEPTTALDVSIQAQIMALLRKLCRERRLGVMLITHDIGVVGEIADRVAVMYAGKVVEMGPVLQVLNDPLHPYTRGLIGAIPELGGSRQRLAQIRGAMPSLASLPAGCAFHARCPQALARCATQRPPETTIGDERTIKCWAIEPRTSLETEAVA